MDLIKKHLLLVLNLVSGYILYAQTITAPGVKTATSFAIVVDKDTYDKTKDALLAYRNMLETKEGLGTYMIVNNWQNPDEVKNALLSLMKKSPVLEGAVFIGHIPVALVRNAQHMTTAFKMDEIKYPIQQSSVASDRFYDDFDLIFRFLNKDEKHADWFYYELEESSPQVIRSDIYTARIMSHLGGEAQYAEISAFLRKAVNARNHQEPLDNLLSFTGSGYNSESLTAWADEKSALKELFPQAFRNPSTSKMLNFRMDPQMKFRLFSELQRPELDVALLSEHGDISKQYINNPAQDVPAANTSILTADLKQFTPQSKVIIFNACYNGSFHHSANISGAYIFSPGNTLVVQGNTTNVLQDKWALDQLGLLEKGVRVGLWATQSNTLEAHLSGDPTWHFTAISEMNQRLVTNRNKAAYWKSLLPVSDPVTQSLALKQLFETGTPGLSQLLLQTYRRSPSVNLRMQCLTLLSRTGGTNYTNILLLALNDSYELIRRKAADWASKSGDDILIPKLVDLILQTPNDERVVYNAEKCLALMDADKVSVEIKRQMKAATYLFNKDEVLSAWLKEVDKDKSRAVNCINIIEDKQKSESERILEIRKVRNNTYHFLVPRLLKIAEDSSETIAVRQNMIEALGWFSNSYQKSLIIATCSRIQNNTENNMLINREAMQTVLRLEKWNLQ